MTKSTIPTDEELGVVILPLSYLINHKTGDSFYRAMFPVEIDIKLSEGYDLVDKRTLVEFRERQFKLNEARHAKNLARRLRRQHGKRN